MKSFSTISNLLSLLTIIFIVASCKKSDPYQPTAQEQLQNKDWKLSSITINPALNGTTDYLNGTMQPCERDNTYRFGYNVLWQGFYLEENTDKCDPMYSEYTGTWVYNASTKILGFNYGSSTTGIYGYSMTIESLSDNAFTGKTTETISGNTYSKTWTFIKN